MQAIGICRFSYPGEGGFQVEHGSLEERIAYLYAPARMEERFATFETMMLPPLRQQTDADFTLLIVIGDSLPSVYRARLEAAVADMPQVVIRACAPGPHRKVMQQAINAVRRKSDAPSLQFRMDDDDAVACDFIARLREAAHDVAPLVQRHRHVAIDFNRGYIVRPTGEGLMVAPTDQPYATAALALMVRADVPVTVMNFAHAKLPRVMPTVTFTDSDMMIRGHNDHNDSRQKPGLRTPRLLPLDAEGKAHFRRTFGIDADAVTRRFAGLPA